MQLFKKCQGPSNFHPLLDQLHHPAIPLLTASKETGVPVVLKSTPWSLEEKDAAMKRGSHKSADEFTTFLRSEMATMGKKGMFIVLPYKLIRHLPGLRLSPIDCIPQRERRPRMVNDYSFYSINQATLKLAPQESMQWGKIAFFGTFILQIDLTVLSSSQKPIWRMVFIV